MRADIIEKRMSGERCTQGKAMFFDVSLPVNRYLYSVSHVSQRRVCMHDAVVFHSALMDRVGICKTLSHRWCNVIGSDVYTRLCRMEST